MDVETNCSTPGCFRAAQVGPVVGGKCIPCSRGVTPQPPPEFRLFSARPRCSSCGKEIPIGDTVYEINGYVSTYFECAMCFTPEAEDCPDCGCPGVDYDGHVCEDYQNLRRVKDLEQALEGIMELASGVPIFIPFWEIAFTALRDKPR